MIDPWTFAGELLAEFGRSDMAGGAPMAAHVWLANSFSHLSFGAWAGLWRWPRLVLWTAWAALAFKEAASDLPNAGFALNVWTDSAIDLALPLVGFMAARRALMGPAR